MFVEMFQFTRSCRPSNRNAIFHTTQRSNFTILPSNPPNITYLTVEQLNSSISSGEMNQNSIDRAFQGKPRVSTNIAKTKDFTICVVAGRNTSNLGVVEQPVVDGIASKRIVVPVDS